MGLLAQLQGGPDTSLVQPGGVSITPWGFLGYLSGEAPEIWRKGSWMESLWCFSGSHDLEVTGVFIGVTPAERAHPFPLFKGHLAAACGRTLGFCCPGGGILIRDVLGLLLC